MSQLIVPMSRISEDGESLEWETWDGSEWLERRADASGLIDEFAALARPRPVVAFHARVLELARAFGPLSFCGQPACGKPHRIEWRMVAPRRHGPSRELVSEWSRAAEHVNALRRLMYTLRTSPGELSDWDVVWPDRPNGPTAGPDHDLAEATGLERPAIPWGDLAWERRRVAEHLDSWRSSTHRDEVIRWDDQSPAIEARSSSLIGDLGNALAGALVEGERIRICTGTAHGRPCRITWTVVRDKPRSAPMLCEGCYAAYRQQDRKEEEQ